jgi:hypothetical protein
MAAVPMERGPRRRRDPKKTYTTSGGDVCNRGPTSSMPMRMNVESSTVTPPQAKVRVTGNLCYSDAGEATTPCQIPPPRISRLVSSRKGRYERHSRKQGLLRDSGCEVLARRRRIHRSRRPARRLVARSRRSCIGGGGRRRVEVAQEWISTRSACVRGRPKLLGNSVDNPANDVIAFTCDTFETVPVNDANAAAAVVDQAGPL